MKRTYFCLWFIMVLAMIASPIWALTYDFEVDGIYYKRANNGVWVHYQTESEPFQNSAGYSGDVVIPATVTYNGIAYPVTGIGSKAFNNCPELTSIVIGENVKKIFDLAFYGCSGLTTVEIPNSVERIGYGVFSNCFSLTSIKISENIKNIPEGAFGCCTSLEQIEIPATITRINELAFDGCTSLKKVVFADTETSLSLTEDLIMKETNTFGYAGSEDPAKGGTPLESIYIGRNLDFTTTSEYKYSPFYNRQKIKSVTFGDKVTRIYSNMFRNCGGITSITIPASVTSIGDYAFYQCSKLDSVIVMNSTPLVITSGVFSNRANATLWVPVGALEAYAEANYWKDFKEIKEMTSIEFEDDVVKAICVENWDTNNDKELSYDEAAAVSSLGSVFGENTDITTFNELQYFTGLTKVGKSAFTNCQHLASVTLPTTIKEISEEAFACCISLHGMNIPEGVTSIAERAFYGCTGMTSVAFPESLSSFGTQAFANTGLEEVDLPEGLQAIGLGVFNQCNKLKKVKIPASVADMENPFEGAINLSMVFVKYAEPIPIESTTFPYRSTAALYVPKGTSAAYAKADFWKEFGEIVEYIDFKDEAVKTACISNWDTNGDGELSYTEAAAVTNLGTTFKDNVAITTFDELQYFTNITNIASYAFQNCTGLKSVVLPEGVTTIGYCGFTGCTNLSSINIPTGVTSISYQAFGRCSSLTSMPLPEGLTSMGEAAFYDCKGITSISIPKGMEYIPASAFSGCTSLQTVTIPNNVKYIYQQAFIGCGNVKDLTLPEGLKSIGAMSMPEGLWRITLPSTLEFIGSNAFTFDLVRVTALNPIPVDIDALVFQGRTQPDAILYVPKGALEAYKEAKYWKEFTTIMEIGSDDPSENPTSQTLQDGNTYAGNIEYLIEELIYKRTFTNIEWQALYVPFAMSYEDWADDFEVARLNDVHQYDDDGDGEPDRTVLETFKMKKGSTIANTPYLIRTLSPGAKTISLTDVTLHKAEERSFDVSSWTTLFTFTGTYTGISGADMIANGYYAMGNGTLLQTASEESNLGSFRWYMNITDRDGNPKSLGEVKVMVFDGDADGVEEIREEDKITDDAVYDLTGRRIINGNGQPAYPRKGIYIRNGRKYLVR
ncbi:MAG: leucine-rich repeat domain-containing protein [Bacteroidaceae bacterium]|nr:leucine-rich repeat domain-containing protein [Bacteroidaceae bacterium]